MNPWIHVSIPGRSDDEPTLWAAFNRETRKSSRLFKNRADAVKEAKRRNRKIERATAKAQQRKEALSAERRAENERKALLKPFVKTLFAGEPGAADVVADWLEERGECELAQRIRNCSTALKLRIDSDLSNINRHVVDTSIGRVISQVNWDVLFILGAVACEYWHLWYNDHRQHRTRYDRVQKNATKAATKLVKRHYANAN